jgi:hypothetical protein
MFVDKYYVDCESGTYSDALTAFGFANVLSRAMQDGGQSPEVTIRNLCTTYLLQLEAPLTEEIVRKASYPHEILPFIQNDRHPEGAAHYPLRDYLSRLRAQTAGTVEAADSEQAAQFELPSDLGIYSIIEVLQGDGLINRVAARLWGQRRQYSELLRIALGMYCQTPNRVEEGRRAFAAWKRCGRDANFKSDDALLAIFNPAWQKSINSARPAGSENKNYKGFWIPEWLKMVGMPHSGLLVSVRSGRERGRFSEEDKKVYVLAPARIGLQNHSAIMKDFQRSLYSASAVKADIIVLLTYSDKLLLYVEREGRIPRFARFRDAVEGFYTAYFKKSGRQRSAYSLTNLAFLQLPGWVKLPQPVTVEAISEFRRLIDSQREVLLYRYPSAGGFADFIDESTGEGNHLLRQYREFLSGGSLEALLDFFTGFACLLIRQLARGEKVRQFQLSQLRRLLLLMETSMKPTLEEIISDDGFQEMARAIRLSTVTAQRLKSKDIRTHHEIRYGLAQELKRKAPFKIEFVAALMKFVNQYQAENARYRERGGLNIHEVTTTHLQRIIGLIDRCGGHGAEPVASLLIAYGYAYDDIRTEEDEKLAADLITNSPKEVQQ